MALGHQAGLRDLRSMAPPACALQMPARGRWQREWPAVAPGKELVRWRISAYSSGAWYEGFVIRYALRPAMGAAAAAHCFQVYYDETEEDEWFEWPEPSLVFDASQP